MFSTDIFSEVRQNAALCGNGLKSCWLQEFLAELSPLPKMFSGFIYISSHMSKVCIYFSSACFSILSYLKVVSLVRDIVFFSCIIATGCLSVSAQTNGAMWAVWSETYIMCNDYVCLWFGKEKYLHTNKSPRVIMVENNGRKNYLGLERCSMLNLFIFFSVKNKD